MPSAPAENPGSEAKPAAGVVVEWVAELPAVAAMGFALGLAAAGAVAGTEWDAAVPVVEAEFAPVTAPAFPRASPNQR